MESTAQRRVRQVRRCPGNEVRCRFAAEQRHAVDEFLRVRVLRTGVHAGGPTDFHDLPSVHDRHVVGKFARETQVVRDENVREVGVPLKILQEVDDVGLRHHVQGRRGLVKNDHVGLHDKGHGDHDALLHPAAKFVGEAPQNVFRKPHVLEPLCGRRDGFLPIRA